MKCYSIHRTLIRVIPVLLFFIFPVFLFAQSDNCTAPTSISSATTCIDGTSRLTGQTIRNQTPSSPNVTGGTCTGTPGVDVWYSFVAKSTNPTIALSNIGSDLRASNGGTKIQVLSGTCPSGFISEACTSGTGTTLNLTPTTLTVGQTYFIRVYTNATTATSGSSTSWGYTICVTDPPPANDAFASPATLIPAIACSNTTGTLFNATYTAGTPTVSGTCAGTPSADVWYRFTAPTDVVSIPLTAGSEVSGVEVITQSGANYYSIACGGPTGIPAVAVVPGTTYYIRVYKTGAAPVSAANAAFTICVTAAAPPNDDCSGAIELNVLANCVTVYGTVSMATLSNGFGTTGTCTGSGTAAYDVWYKFTATTANPTITLNNFGSAFTGTHRAELYSSSCGSLTPMNQCGSATTGAATINATGLTVGATYFIRVYSTSPPAIGDGKFSICITSGGTSNVRVGNSYVNITKNTVGGVVEKNDILEIRMTISVGAGTTLYRSRYVDNVPSKTAMETASEIQVITNEGLRYRGYTATDGINDDAATYKSALGPNEYNVRLNLGTTGTLPTAPANNLATDLTGANNLVSSSTAVPRASGQLLFATAFRVKVTGNVGDTIVLNGGKFLYRTAAGSTADSVLSGTPYKILISNPLSLCANSVGINNASEDGGTFGSGNTMNRSYDLSSPIAGYSFVAQSNAQDVGDGRYAIVNNSSPRAGTNENAVMQPNPNPANVAPDLARENRMFNGFWYIDGDHTGQTTALGNAPAAQGSNGGYMLVVNADFVASEVYRQELKNLCPNTYYEFSAWFKNLCATCGADSTGGQFAGRPTAPSAGYPGVLPNLSFALDGVDRYSTGQIGVLSESGGWVKKGFVFITGPTQTEATFSIRNNSQGGGGNDWAMDDISIATCLPSMTYTPTLNPSVCQFAPIEISNTMRSFFNNYNYYKWQRSTDGGNTWFDIPGETGSKTPALENGQWEYATSYTVPPAHTTMANNGDRYRQIVATTAANLNGTTCQSTDGISIISLNVLPDCNPLNTDLLSFNGKVQNNHSYLTWTTSKERGPVVFALEKSTDGIHFTRIGTVESYNNPAAENNTYSFTDPVAVTGKTLYRIAVSSNAVIIKYSRTIQLGTPVESFKTEVKTNPFNKDLYFDVTIDKDAKIEVRLLNATGNVVKQKSYTGYAGINSFSLQNTGSLAPGVYILQVQHKEKLVTHKVIRN